MDIYDKQIRVVERTKNARFYDETLVVEAIGKKSDPLADGLLETLNYLPEEEKNIFFRNAIRRLVVQALDTAHALNIEFARSFGKETLHGYASPDSYGEAIDHIPGDLSQAVILEALKDTNRTLGERPL